MCAVSVKGERLLLNNTKVVQKFVIDSSYEAEGTSLAKVNNQSKNKNEFRLLLEACVLESGLPTKKS